MDCVTVEGDSLALFTAIHRFSKIQFVAKYQKNEGNIKKNEQ